jgi:hypothetical protein
MPAFAYRILPPRANFVATITDGEAATMGAHFGFLQGLEAEGRVIFVGRCDNGDWGLGVFEFADEARRGRCCRATLPSRRASCVWSFTRSSWSWSAGRRPADAVVVDGVRRGMSG